MPNPSPARLTRREREILHAVFASGNRATADEIRQRLADPPSDSSVRVMLARLEDKGLLRHAVDGVRYVYSATRSPAAAGRTAVDELIHTFYNGSMVQMMAALVRRGTWAPEDLDTLEAAIEAARAQEQSGRRLNREDA